MSSVIYQITPNNQKEIQPVTVETFRTGGIEIEVVQPRQSHSAQIEQTSNGLTNFPAVHPPTAQIPEKRTIEELEAFLKQQSAIVRIPVTLESLHPAQNSDTNAEQLNNGKPKVFAIATKKLAK